MHILHTESSTGWGGQEIRILKESLGLKQRGFQITLAVQKGGQLVDKARQQGLEVFECDFRRWKAVSTVKRLSSLLIEKKVDLVNTHSSLDAWIGGIAARLRGKKVVRTRHLSTPIRGGWNARLLYNRLADFVVTTSSSIIPFLQQQARLPSHRIQCIPTGVEPIEVSATDRVAFRQSLGVADHEVLVGSVCVVRSWKGIADLIEAAKILRHEPYLKWVVVGGGYLERFMPLLDPSLPFTFTGHLENPRSAIAALDIFALLSTAHEGISQASLQAAALKKPLVTTSIGGLPEICIDGVTGRVVPPATPLEVAQAILELAKDPLLRARMGHAAYEHVMRSYTLEQTLHAMAEVFQTVGGKAD